MQILSLFFVILWSFTVFSFFYLMFLILWSYVVLSCVCVCVFPPGHGYCHQTGRNGQMPMDGHTMLTTVPACRSGTFPAGQYIATLSGLVTCLLSCLMCTAGLCMLFSVLHAQDRWTLFSAALHSQRPSRLLGMGSPGRPPQLSHSS